MNLMNRVKQLAGLGLRLEVELPQSYLVPGSAVVYHITLQSEEAVTVRALTAEVVMGTAPPGSMNWGSGPACAASEPIMDIVVEEGVPVYFSGSIRLPEDAAPTVNDPHGATYWCLRVTADVPQGRDPSTVVGFVVGPAYQFDWHTVEPVEVEVPGRPRRLVMAHGTCTIVQPAEITSDELQRLVQEEITATLTDLLSEQEEFLSTQSLDEEMRYELSGMLRESVSPRIRESTSIPIDSVAELTLEELTIEPG
ncbi:MAG: hypothetical protein M3220_11465 [Chloroflexota bacterium]|nr:hypothetical protein [Chloroflexota bacterium]